MRVRAVRILLVLGILAAVAWVLRAMRGGPAPALDKAPEPSKPWPPLALRPEEQAVAADGSSPIPEDTSWRSQVGEALPHLIEAPAELRPEPPDGPTGLPVDGPVWVEPVEGLCPTTHPVKAKLGSGIYHAPGGLNYDRTRPDRCYVSVEAAELDGLRKPKR
jgi:hypothetical protein